MRYIVAHRKFANLHFRQGLLEMPNQHVFYDIKFLRRDYMYSSYHNTGSEPLVHIHVNADSISELTSWLL